MPVNLDQPQRWKRDIAASVAFYNAWFLEFAPQSFRQARAATLGEVAATFHTTANLRTITPAVLMNAPHILPTLRMATAPPLARDRLIGLAQVSATLVDNMEKQGRIPPRMTPERVERELAQITTTIRALVDQDLVTWLDTSTDDDHALHQAQVVIADRLCSALVDPILRNAQEQRQLKAIGAWLTERGYREERPTSIDHMATGTFAFRVRVTAEHGTGRTVHIPMDVVIMPHSAARDSLPVLIEAKSAGDFTNTNKRRKEEAAKVNQLRHTYGQAVTFVLMLCGYFDSGYLGYEAAEGIDWVWEHRLDDLAGLGL